MAELAGVLVGNYFLLECLAREGMVETYRARPTTRGGYDVILRLFRPEFPDPTSFRERFAGEVEKVWRCHHEHIQPLIEFGTGDDLLYCATLIPEAETLEQYLQRMEQLPEYFLPVPIVLRFVAQLCDELQYAHEQGIMHGNIQPASILVQDEEEVLLTQFGMKRAYQDGEPFVAQIDEGNAAYIAPEQALGMIRPASDIYALGVTLFRSFTGAFPYGNPDATGMPRLERSHDIATLRPDLPAWLQATLGRAIAVDPAERFSDMAEFAAELEGGPMYMPLPARRTPSNSLR